MDEAHRLGSSGLARLARLIASYSSSVKGKKAFALSDS